jgi:hypothetical protein
MLGDAHAGIDGRVRCLTRFRGEVCNSPMSAGSPSGWTGWT